MLVIGLILVGLGVMLAAGVAASGGNSTTLEVFGLDLDMRSSVVFFTGAGTAAAALLGLWLAKKGLARGYRRRKEVRELRRQQSRPAPVAALPGEQPGDEPETVAESNDVPPEQEHEPDAEPEPAEVGERTEKKD